MKRLYSFIFHYIFKWKIINHIKNIPTNIIVLCAPYTSNFDKFIISLAVKTMNWKFIWLRLNDIFIKNKKKYFKYKLLVFPENTKKKTEHWNIYSIRIARSKNIPILILILDYKSKSIILKDILNANKLSIKESIIEIKEHYKSLETNAKYSDNFSIPDIKLY